MIILKMGWVGGEGGEHPNRFQEIAMEILKCEAGREAGWQGGREGGRGEMNLFQWQQNS